jgi:hypothetical protein
LIIENYPAFVVIDHMKKKSSTENLSSNMKDTHYCPHLTDNS